MDMTLYFICYIVQQYEFAMFLQVAKKLWKFKVLHSDYQQLGYTEKDFNPQL